MPSPIKDRTSQKHVGFGKVILFGEHFVVHGAEAIVAGVSEYTECSLELLRGHPGVEVVDKRPAVPGYIKNKRAEQKKAHQLVLDHLQIDTKKDGLRIHLGGPLVPSSGIGASASDVVALSRALSEMFNLGLSEDQVNHSAFVGEGGYHGTPSGVDNTAATFGGLISYKRVSGKSSFSFIPFSTPLYLVVVGTGITASTVQVVKDVGAMKQNKPEYFGKIFSEYNALVARALEAIKGGDVAAVGRLMNQCHTLCQKIDISCSELESIVNSSRRYGALGAKLSGTGRGGIAVALAADAESRDRIAEGLQRTCKEAKFIWKYTVTPKKSHLKHNGLIYTSIYICYQSGKDREEIKTVMNYDKFSADRGDQASLCSPSSSWSRIRFTPLSGSSDLLNQQHSCIYGEFGFHAGWRNDCHCLVPVSPFPGAFGVKECIPNISIEGLLRTDCQMPPKCIFPRPAAAATDGWGPLESDGASRRLRREENLQRIGSLRLALSSIVSSRSCSAASRTPVRHVEPKPRSPASPEPVLASASSTAAPMDTAAMLQARLREAKKEIKVLVAERDSLLVASRKREEQLHHLILAPADAPLEHSTASLHPVVALGPAGAEGDGSTLRSLREVVGAARLLVQAAGGVAPDTDEPGVSGELAEALRHLARRVPDLLTPEQAQEMVAQAVEGAHAEIKALLQEKVRGGDQVLYLAQQLENLSKSRQGEASNWREREAMLQAAVVDLTLQLEEHQRHALVRQEENSRALEMLQLRASEEAVAARADAQREWEERLRRCETEARELHEAHKAELAEFREGQAAADKQLQELQTAQDDLLSNAATSVLAVCRVLTGDTSAAVLSEPTPAAQLTAALKRLDEAAAANVQQRLNSGSHPSTGREDFDAVSGPAPSMVCPAVRDDTPLPELDPGIGAAMQEVLRGGGPCHTASLAAAVGLEQWESATASAGVFYQVGGAVIAAAGLLTAPLHRQWRRLLLLLQHCMESGVGAGRPSAAADVACWCFSFLHRHGTAPRDWAGDPLFSTLCVLMAPLRLCYPSAAERDLWRLVYGIIDQCESYNLSDDEDCICPPVGIDRVPFLRRLRSVVRRGCACVQGQTIAAALCRDQWDDADAAAWSRDAGLVVLQLVVEAGELGRYQAEVPRLLSTAASASALESALAALDGTVLPALVLLCQAVPEAADEIAPFLECRQQYVVVLEAIEADEAAQEKEDAADAVIPLPGAAVPTTAVGRCLQATQRQHRVRVDAAVSPVSSGSGAEASQHALLPEVLQLYEENKAYRLYLEELLAASLGRIPHTPYPKPHVSSSCWCQDCTSPAMGAGGTLVQDVMMNDWNGGTVSCMSPPAPISASARRSVLSLPDNSPIQHY
eukprot:gene3606-2546_t